MGKHNKNKQPKRKRNPSSPGVRKNPVLKRNKLVFSCDPSDSEGELTEYLDAVESDSESSDTPPTIMKFSKEDLASISSQLAPLIIKELKQSLKEECLSELRKELSEIVIKETQPLREEINRLNAELEKAKLDHDELAQYGRRTCLDVSNIPDDTGSFDEPVEAKFLEFTKKAKIPITATDIDKIYRKGKPKMNVNRKVIVKFTNSKARDRVYKSRKSLSDGLFVQDNITPFRESLGYEARKLKRENLIEKTWIAGCRVNVLLNGEVAGRVVKSMEAIKAIREGKPFPTDREKV